MPICVKGNDVRSETKAKILSWLVTAGIGVNGLTEGVFIWLSLCCAHQNRLRLSHASRKH